MPGVALSAPGRVGPRVSLFDTLIGIISGGLLDSFAEKISGLRLLGRPPVTSVLSSDGFSQEIPVSALSAAGRVVSGSR